MNILMTCVTMMSAGYMIACSATPSGRNATETPPVDSFQQALLIANTRQIERTKLWPEQHSPEQDPAAFVSLVQQMADDMSRYLDDLKDLDPPSSRRRDFDKYLDAIEALISNDREFARVFALEGVTARSETLLQQHFSLNRAFVVMCYQLLSSPQDTCAALLGGPTTATSSDSEGLVTLDE